MTNPNNLDERVFGLLMGLGLGVFIGFFLRDSNRKPATLRGA